MKQNYLTPGFSPLVIVYNSKSHKVRNVTVVSKIQSSQLSKKKSVKSQFSQQKSGKSQLSQQK